MRLMSNRVHLVLLKPMCQPRAFSTNWAETLKQHHFKPTKQPISQVFLEPETEKIDQKEVTIKILSTYFKLFGDFLLSNQDLADVVVICHKWLQLCRSVDLI